MIRPLIFSILFTLFGLILNAQTPDDQQNEAQQMLEQSIEKGECMGVAAGILKDGIIQWMGSAGLADSKLSRSFLPTTQTRIASIAKPMTAIAIMQLYESKKIDLDDPIQKYIPEYPIKPEGEISIRHLLSHSSGIGAYQSNKERENKTNYSNLSEAVKIFWDRPLLFEPGQQFQYTSYGYVVLGLIIERASNMSYEDYVQKNIWDPSGMKNTGIEYPKKYETTNSSTYHKSSNGKIKEEKPTNLTDRIPGGGFYSTTEDILLFAKAVLENSLITSETLKLMTQDTGLKKEGNPYGFGWYLYGTNPNYGFVYGHNGAQLGASTFLFILPEVKTAVVVLSNTSGSMQEVSNISVSLFNIAATFEN